VYRVLGWPWAIPVALIDVLKGAVPAGLWARWADGPEWLAPALGGAAVLGHVFSPFVGFKGGKGVATACGVFSVLTPQAVFPALAVFLSVVWITRYISVGSILASVALPPIAYATGSPPAVLAAAIAAAMLIVVRHRTNLARVLAGTEQRIGLRLMSREP
jgi:glycerol-3-phosphate acyltransferase PlsY